MPISDEALQNPKNRFIAVSADAKLGQAIAALKSLDGQPWWHLVVQKDDGAWGVARFSELGASLATTASAPEIRLGEAGELQTATAVARNDLDTKAAQALARKSPARVVVVIEDAVPVGILVEGVTRGGGASTMGASVVPSATLEQLGGKYVKLKDYGSILLSCSKK